MNPLSPLIRKLAYAGLIPFVALALMVQLAPTPVNYLSAESLAGYGAIITSFMGAIHWGANLHTNSPFSLWNGVCIIFIPLLSAIPQFSH